MARGPTAWLMILLFTPLWAQGGKLEQVRKEVRAEMPQQDKDQDCCDHDDEDSILGALIGQLIAGCLAGLFQHDPAAPTGYFTESPYAQGRDGFMWMHDPHQPIDPHDNPLVKTWSVRVSVEESNDFDGLNRVNGFLLLENSLGFGLQGSWSILDERLEAGRHDSLFLGDLNLTCRFLETERSQVRGGLGCRLLSDAQTDWGINATFSADAYPCRPLIVSTLFDVGTLGSATVFHGRGTLGAIWQCFEVFGGYDFLRIGSINLQGPVIGLRIWF